MRKNLPSVSTVVLILGLSVRVLAQGSVLDKSFGTNGTVTAFIAGGDSIHDKGRAVAIQSDGKIVVAGYSQDQSPHRAFALARFNTSGALDDTFGTNGTARTFIAGGDSMDDEANAVAIQSDGMIVLAGFSTGTNNGNTQSAFAVARFNPDGTIDKTFGVNGTARTFISGSDSLDDDGVSVAVQPDGKIVVAGLSIYFPAYHGIGVARFNSDGTPDNTFGTNGSIIVTGIGRENLSDRGNCLAIQSDGKYIVAGWLVNGGTGANLFAVARLNADGTNDNSFGVGGVASTSISGGIGDDAGYCDALQSDGKILVAGFSMDTTGGPEQEAFALARFDTDGTIDNGFGTDGSARIFINGGGKFADVCNSITIQSDGKIVLAGSTYSFVQNGDEFGVARFNTNGTPDTTFGIGGTTMTSNFNPGGDINDDAYSAAIQSDGKIVAAGYSEKAAGTSSYEFAVARYLSSNVTGINQTESAPRGFTLLQNYPNPFNPTTKIRYQISEVSHVTLKVYDILGRQVATLVNGRENAGSYSLTFDGSKLASGVYFYRLVAGSHYATKKLLLLK